MASINDLFTNALTQTLAAKNDATSRQRVGRPFAKQMKELSADQFNRLFPRQSHADTQAKLKETLAQLAHSESGAPMAHSAPAKNATLPLLQQQQQLPVAKRTKTMSSGENQDRPVPPQVTDDELLQIIDRTINDDERLYLAEHANGADDAAAAEADEPQECAEEENGRTEPIGSPLIDPRLFDDSEVSDIEEDELELDADGDDDDDDEDDDSDSDASGKQRRRAKSKSAKTKKKGAASARTYRDHAPALAAVSGGENDDEDAFKKVVEATNGTRKRKQPSAGKISEQAKMGKQEQVARKKKRTEDMAVPEKVEEYRQALLDYIQIAAINLFNRNASKPAAGLVLPFSDLLRQDTSDDPELSRMRTSLMRIELEIQESLEIATKAMPQEMAVICDFVSGTESLRELSPAHTVDATQCGVLQKSFPREQLVALETTTLFALGNTTTSSLVVATRLKELIEAMWLLQNLMEVCERRVQERLLAPLPGFVDGQTTLDKARQLLAKDVGRKSVLQFLSKNIRESLVVLDTSTHKLTHGL